MQGQVAKRITNIGGGERHEGRLLGADCDGVPYRRWGCTDAHLVATRLHQRGRQERTPALPGARIKRDCEAIRPLGSDIGRASTVFREPSKAMLPRPMSLPRALM